MSRKEPIVVRAIVEFAVEPDEVGSEEELMSELVGEDVKVKSGAYENRFYGTILSVSPKGATFEMTPQEIVDHSRFVDAMEA